MFVAPALWFAGLSQPATPEALPCNTIARLPSALATVLRWGTYIAALIFTRAEIKFAKFLALQNGFTSVAISPGVFWFSAVMGACFANFALGGILALLRPWWGAPSHAARL